jgi:integrase
MPRPRSDKPYICGPYQHRAKWRVILYTPRSDGGRDRRIRSFDSRSEAETWTKGYQLVRAAAGKTIGDAVNEYVAHLVRKGNKAGSIRTARYRLDAILDTSKALIDLTPRLAQAYYDDLVDEGGATDTQQGCLVAAKAFGNFLVKKLKLLRANPFEAVEPVGRPSRGKAQLSIDDARRFEEHCLAAWTERGDRSAIAAVLPLLMGLRAGEVAQLTARDVDNKGRLLRVGEADSKTEAGRRPVRIPSQLRDPMVALADGLEPEGRLFCKTDKTPADRYWVSWHARRHMKAAKVRVVTAHGLRGTFATMDVLTRGDRSQTAKAMGHTTPTMTERHYIDEQAASDESIDRVSRLLDDD